MRIQERSKQIEKITVEAYDGDARIGVADLIIDPHIEGKPAALVESVEVIENRRRQGIGKALMQRLVELADKRGCYKVVLQCADHNISFYKDCGFQVHQNGMRKNLYKEE